MDRSIKCSFKISTTKVMMVIIMLCACQWMAIFHTGNFIYKADLINLTTIIISTLFIVLLSFRPVVQKRWTGKYGIWVLFSIMLWAIECINSFLSYSGYGQSLINTLSASFGSLAVIALYPMCYLQEKTSDKDYLKKIIKALGCLAAIFTIIQVFLYDYGIVIFDISGTSIRNGTLRFSIAGYVVSIAFIITVFDWIKTRKTSDLIIAVVEIVFLVFAQKTRTEIMYLLFTIYFVAILFLKRKNIKILLAILGGCAAIVAIGSGFVETYISELGSDAGVSMRLETIRYYMQQFVEHPLLGMGYIQPGTSNSILYGFLYGNGRYAGYFYRDDVGLIGVMNEKGILGLIWYVSLMVLMLKQILSMYKRDKKEYVWMLAIWFYITMCSVNIIYVNSLRLTTLLSIVAMIQHYYLISMERRT